jgi:hypothetical protein
MPRALAPSTAHASSLSTIKPRSIVLQFHVDLLHSHTRSGAAREADPEASLQNNPESEGRVVRRRRSRSMGFRKRDISGHAGVLVQILASRCLHARFSQAEQAKIKSDERLRTLLRDPARAGPELERRLHQQVRYYNGVLLIEEPIMHGITTVPATAGWSISCDTLGVEVDFDNAIENGSGASVQLTSIGIGVSQSTCREISMALGTAVLRLTRGE